MKRKGIVLLCDGEGSLSLAVLVVFIGSCTKPAVPEKIEKLRIGIFPDSISARLLCRSGTGFF